MLAVLVRRSMKGRHWMLVIAGAWTVWVCARAFLERSPDSVVREAFTGDAQGAQEIETVAPNSFERQNAARPRISIPPLLAALPRLDLSGRCVTVSGEGIPGAQVGWIQEAVQGTVSEVRQTRAAADGSFVLEGLAPQTLYRICVLAEGFGHVTQMGLPSAQSLRLELPAARDLSGRVVAEEDGVPVGNARIWLSDTSLPSHPVLRAWLLERTPAREAFSNGRGEFRLPGFPQGVPVKVLARARSFLTYTRYLKTSARQAMLRISLQGGEEKMFLVVDSQTGQPIEGAVVEENSEVLAVTGSSGRFPLTLPAREPAGFTDSVILSASGHPALSLDPRAAPATEEPMRIEMGRGGSVEGTVLGPSGEPLAGVEVRLVDHSGWDEAPRLSEWLTYSGQSGAGSAVSDRTGHYRIAGVRPSQVDHELVVLGQVHVLNEALFAHLPRPGSEDHKDVHVVEGGQLFGRVRLPVSHAEPEDAGHRVRALVCLVSDSGRKRSQWTTAGGVYRFMGLHSDEYRVGAFAYSGDHCWAALRNTEPCRIDWSESVRRDVELEKLEVASLSGRVLFDSGQPVEGVRVRAAHHGNWSPKTFTVTTNAMGAFHFEVPGGPGTEWSVSVQRGVSSAKRLGVRAPASELQLELPVLHAVGVRLFERGPRTMLDVGGFRWRRPGSAWRVGTRVLPDTGGVYWLELPAGELDLEVGAVGPDHYPGVLSGLNVSGEELILDLELDRGIRLTLRYTGPEGHGPLPFLGMVWLESLQGERVDQEFDDEPGERSYARMRPGKYVFRGAESVTFDPPSIMVTGVLQQAQPVTWSIQDEAAYERWCAETMEMLRRLE